MVGGAAAGRVTFADGRPLADAHILVIGIEYETEIDAPLDGSGNYRATIEQTDANYRLAGWVDVPFEGETYHLPLEPVGDTDTHFLGADGISRDFVLRLTGRGSWAGQMQADDREALIGGIIGVFVYDPISDPTAARALALPVGSRITVSLRPVAPTLIDGSPAMSITFDVPITRQTGPSTIGEVGDLRGVPLGRFGATATLTDGSGAVTNLVLGVTCSRSGCPLKPASMSPSAEISFLPADNLVHSRPFQGQAVAGLALYVQRP